jgi:transcriptional regulator with XRE-family HTH domain
MGKFTDITERVEVVRTSLGLNKAQFASKIGMKPQTYNNFVGSQGTKPNMALVCGIVRAFNVDPGWLLTGAGEPFADKQPGDLPAPVSPKAGRGAPSPLQSEVKYNTAMLAALKHELDVVLDVYKTRGLALLNSASYPDPRVLHAMDVILHHFWLAPVETASLAMKMIEEFSRIAGEIHWIASQKAAAQQGEGLEKRVTG